MADRTEPEDSRTGTASATASMPVAAAMLVMTYAIATAAGYLTSRTALPLPWMLGPFFTIAVLSLMGMPKRLAPWGRELSQVTIGLAIGLRFTMPMLISVASMIPAMIVSTLYVIAFTMLAALIFKVLANVDRVTAFFATAAGGVADMAHVSQQFGGTPSSVAIVHAMRVSGVVAILPIAVVLIGEPGQNAAAQDVIQGGSGYLALAAGLAFAVLVAFTLKLTPLPNPWLVGAIFGGMVIGLSGLFAVVVPAWAIIIAQLLLGSWLGAQFQRDKLAQLPRVTAAAVAISLFMIVCAAFGAFVLSGLGGLPYSTSFLALAPAAVTEMVLTAKLMNLDAEMVGAFHIVRIAIVSSTVLFVFRIYMNLTGGANGPRI